VGGDRRAAAVTDLYDRLLAVCTCELELVREGRLEELEGCRLAREEIIAAMPPVPTHEARPALERALLITSHIDLELRRRQLEGLTSLRRLRQVRRTADGYAPPRPRASLIVADA
jgi:hypothetical protein